MDGDGRRWENILAVIITIIAMTFFAWRILVVW